MCHHAQLIFVILVEMGFHHVGQAGLKLLTSGEPPALASQSAGITGESHHTWPVLPFSNRKDFLEFSGLGVPLLKGVSLAPRLWHNLDSSHLFPHIS